MTRVSQCLGMLGAVCALSVTCLAQTVLPPQGSEFNPVGKMIGDQVHPGLALSSSGGYLVWEDNATADGSAAIKGVSMAPSGTANGVVRWVSEGVAGDNQNPQVALFANGNKLVVWQGGNLGFQKIFGQIISSDNTLVGTPFQINTYTNNEQIDPVVQVLKDGNAFIAWTSVGQDGDLAGVFARRLSSAGEFLGEEFQVNQTTAYNQRTPALTVLTNGSVLVAWVSEKENADLLPPSINLFGRFYLPTGLPVNSEFKLNEANTNNIVCANPQLATLANGGFNLIWSQRNMSETNNGWDIYSRTFNRFGVADAAAGRINDYTYGDQFGPKIANSGTNQIVVWTSALQDGDWEGIYGRILDGKGAINSDEFRVNTTTVSRQIHPAVADSGVGNAVVAWSGFGPGVNSFDVFAQTYGKVATLVPRLAVSMQEQLTSIQWTTQPGVAYQVQVSSDLSYWENASNPRTATGDTDSLLLIATDKAAYYRVLVLN